MSDITEALILEIDRAIAEGKGAIVDGEISIAELEKELLEKRVNLTIRNAAVAALIAKRTELLADQAPPPPAPEPAVAPAVAGNVYFFAGNAHEKRSPRMPEGRTVERKPPQMPAGRVVVNHAPSIKRDASECALMLFEAEPGPHTVERIAAEVYGDASPRNIKRAQMRIHALKREGRATFTPPLLASTLVHKVP
jgi:hypothetical protein